jgi:predicted LPLAT superfamily acyltransferase
MSIEARVQEWTVMRERGSLPVIRACVWIAIFLGRRVSRLFLYPVCVYFLLHSRAASRASRQYLTRVLGRRAGMRDVFAHFLAFASCLLDRVFLLNEQTDGFDIDVRGEEIVRGFEEAGGGCMLFGAHLGSFEVARMLGRRRELPVSLLMYEENAQKIRAALGAVNPRLTAEVIGLGRADSLLAVADRLQQGHFIGMLVDRNTNGRDMVRYDFLGAPAAFPQGPFRVAMMLQRPIVLMVGLYKGGNRYEVHFELLAPALTARPADPQAWLDDVMRRYVARLEEYCREAPLNWFNFYDFWA